MIIDRNTKPYNPFENSFPLELGDQSGAMHNPSTEISALSDVLKSLFMQIGVLQSQVNRVLKENKELKETQEKFKKDVLEKAEKVEVIDVKKLGYVPLYTTI